jgi:hypothetical protein
MTTITNQEYFKEVCRIGQGHACCRYLAVRGGDGFVCAKLDQSMKQYLDQRVADQDMVARGDNCPGFGV